MQRYASVEQAVEAAKGAWIILHQGNQLNPYINYPFLTLQRLKEYVEQAHAHARSPASERAPPPAGNDRARGVRVVAHRVRPRARRHPRAARARTAGRAAPRFTTDSSMTLSHEEIAFGYALACANFVSQCYHQCILYTVQYTGTHVL